MPPGSGALEVPRTVAPVHSLRPNPCPTHIISLVDDLHVRIVNATTGELLRELIIDTSRDYQPQKKTKPPNP